MPDSLSNIDMKSNLESVFTETFCFLQKPMCWQNESPENRKSSTADNKVSLTLLGTFCFPNKTKGKKGSLFPRFLASSTLEDWGCEKWHLACFCGYTRIEVFASLLCYKDDDGFLGVLCASTVKMTVAWLWLLLREGDGVENFTLKRGWGIFLLCSIDRGVHSSQDSEHNASLIPRTWPPSN